ncbi:MAG: glutathione-disulfide reductase [Rhodospirillaceae bacterium]|nr:glutathione-disulfide reductase [Rhodospirillaceae bacterium]MYJ73323.1 glutathione-disulfide reductase [Rhodospirillaceae bacterium]
MSGYDFDFFVIGAGSGGTRASRIAAAHGARVGVAEERHLGGTCVNVGCVPKKLFTYAAHFAEDFEDAAGFGWTVGPRGHAWPALIANKNREIARLNGIYERLIEGPGAEIFDARAVFIDIHTLDVGGRRVTADKILIAVGGRPFVPDIPGREHVITSDDAFFLPELPERIVIVGGGYIAVEFAGIFTGLGAQVTQIYRGNPFLRGFDDDVRQFLADEMVKKGVDLRFDADVGRVARRPGGGFSVGLESGGSVETDLVMYATGRVPNTGGLGLEAAGVATGRNGAVTVDAGWRSNVDNIYAIGDVTDRIQLTPVAIQEGHALADALFNPSGKTVGYEFVPSAVFSQPEIGTVGYTEAEARAKFGALDIYRSEFRPMKHTLSGRDERGLMKLVVVRETRRVVGLHVVGPGAGEMTQGFAVAINMGATKQDLDATIGIHPTAAEELVTMREPVPDPVPLAAE